MEFDFEKEMKEHEERVKNTVLSEEFIPAINYESEIIYKNLLVVRDLLKDIHFVNSWEPIEVFFNIIQERIEESKEINRNIYYTYYEGAQFDSGEAANKYTLFVEPLSLYRYYGNGTSFEYCIDIDICDRTFDSNKFIKAIIERIESISSMDIYSTLDYQARDNIEEYGENAVYSLLSVNHVDKLIKMYTDKSIHPYLGKSEIQQLNDNLIDKISVGKNLAIKKGKNFISGNKALIIQFGDEFLGLLPNDFGKFLCPGIESGYIKYEAQVAEIDTTKKNNTRVSVNVTAKKGEKV